MQPTFTIHDREDSADLMNLVRHDLGLSAQGKRIARTTAWKDYAQKTALSAELIQLAENVS